MSSDRVSSRRRVRAHRPRARVVLAPTVAPVALLSLAAVAAARPVAAQVPGVPSGQSAFVWPGLVVAANAAVEARALAPERVGEDRRSRWTYGGAAAFAPASARWQVSGGVAAQSWGTGYRDPAAALGGRAALAVWQRARLGATAFAGIGLARARLEPVAGDPGAPDDGSDDTDEETVRLRQIPVGVALGMRGAWGGTRAWAVSVAPQYVWYALSAFGDEVSDGRARITAMAEVGLTSRLGLSLAYEDGGRASGLEPGPRGGTFGVGVSFALRGR